MQKSLILRRSHSILVLVLLLFASASLSFHLPSASATSQPSETPPWIVSGAYLNYSVAGSFSLSDKLSNGSSMSLGGEVSGSVKILVNAVANDQASVTYSPNLVYSSTESYLNGTVVTHSGASTPVNGTSTETQNLSQYSFGDVFSKLQNVANSSYGFTPNFNVTLSKNPGALYELNSTTKLVALALNSTMTEKLSFPGQLSGASPSISLNGSFSSFTSIADQLPLELSLSFEGSTTLSGASMFLSGVGDQSLSATISGNAGLELHLTSTNVNLPTGGNQATIAVPNYSTTLYVLSNSTITGAGTSGNQLLVNVTGPSGTHGVLDVFVSNSMLSQAGITNATQVGVSIDGQTYSNYTITQIDGGYLFTIYYHHSSHAVAMTFGSGDLGSNQGRVSSIGAGSNGAETLFGLQAVEFYIVIAVALGVAVVGALAFASMRKKGKKSSEEAPAAATSCELPAAAPPAPDSGNAAGAPSPEQTTSG